MNTRLTVRELISLTRFAWVVLLTLIAVSLAGNVLHSPSGIVGGAIAGTSPAVLAATAYALERVPWTRTWVSLASTLVTLLVAGVAFWVSWLHLSSLAYEHGERDGTQYAFPLVVDGGIIGMSLLLLRLKQLRTAGDVPPAVPGDVPGTVPPQVSGERGTVPPVPATVGDPVPAVPAGIAGDVPEGHVPALPASPIPAVPRPPRDSRDIPRGTVSPGGTVPPGDTPRDAGTAGTGDRDAPSLDVAAGDRLSLDVAELDRVYGNACPGVKVVQRERGWGGDRAAAAVRAYKARK